jgi:hypothetical protein
MCHDSFGVSTTFQVKESNWFLWKIEIFIFFEKSIHFSFHFEFIFCVYFWICFQFHWCEKTQDMGAMIAIYLCFVQFIQIITLWAFFSSKSKNFGVNRLSKGQMFEFNFPKIIESF